MILCIQIGKFKFDFDQYMLQNLLKFIISGLLQIKQCSFKGFRRTENCNQSNPIIDKSEGDTNNLGYFD